MPSWQRTTVTQAAAAQVVGVTEVVVATLGGISSAYPGQLFLVQGWLWGDTRSSILTVRLRRGTLITSPAIGTAVLQDVAVGGTSEQDCTIDAVDTAAGEMAGGSYVLTAQGGGAGTITVRVFSLQVTAL
jgi:hypothetical protein